MFRRWVEARRRAASGRAAADLQDWLTSIESIVAVCTGSLRDRVVASDIGVTLDRVDRELMRFRNHAADVRRPLRRHSPPLASRVAQATDQVYGLRNLTCAFLIRWQTAEKIDPAAPRALDARREMEEARLRATESARGLAAELQVLSPELRQVISIWGGLPLLDHGNEDRSQPSEPAGDGEQDPISETE